MKIKRILSGIALLTACAIPACTTSCTGGGGESETNGKISDISSNGGSTIYVGNTIQLTVTTNGVKGDEVSWTSSNTNSVSIEKTTNDDSYSKITIKGVALGSSTITAAVGDYKKTYSITVANKTKDVQITEIQIEPVNVLVGKTTTCEYHIYPSNAANQSLSWSSEDKSVAKVDSNGKVTGISVGNTTITAAATDNSGITASAAVTVTQTEVKITSISLNSISLVKDTSVKASYTITPSNATNKTLTWTIGNSSIATVDSSGYVKGITAGRTTLTAKATDGSNVSATTNVTITDATPTPTTETPEEFIQNRTFSIAASGDGGTCYGTAWIVADATPNDFTDYKYYLATNYHVWDGILSVVTSQEDFNIYLADGEGTKSSSEYKTVYSSKYSVVSQSNFFYSDTSSEYDHTGIDLALLQVDLSGISSFQDKLDNLNAMQSSKGYITPFVEPTTASKSYISTNMYTGGYPYKSGGATWEYHQINTTTFNMTYYNKPTVISGDWSHSADENNYILDISPQYFCDYDVGGNWMKGGASGSMLVGEYDGELKVAAIYWGGWGNNAQTIFYPSYSIFRSSYKDFISKYI